MKKISTLMGVITVLLIVTTMICGFWINSNHITEASSLSFHMMSANLTVLSLVIYLICNRQYKKANKN